MTQQDEDGPQRQASIDEQPLPKRAAAPRWKQAKTAVHSNLANSPANLANSPQHKIHDGEN